MEVVSVAVASESVEDERRLLKMEAVAKKLTDPPTKDAAKQAAATQASVGLKKYTFRLKKPDGVNAFESNGVCNRFVISNASKHPSIEPIEASIKGVATRCIAIVADISSLQSTPVNSSS